MPEHSTTKAKHPNRYGGKKRKPSWGMRSKTEVPSSMLRAVKVTEVTLGKKTWMVPVLIQIGVLTILGAHRGWENNQPSLQCVVSAREISRLLGVNLDTVRGALGALQISDLLVKHDSRGWLLQPPKRPDDRVTHRPDHRVNGESERPDDRVNGAPNSFSPPPKSVESSPSSTNPSGSFSSGEDNPASGGGKPKEAAAAAGSNNDFKRDMYDSMELAFHERTFNEKTQTWMTNLHVTHRNRPTEIPISLISTEKGPEDGVLTIGKNEYVKLPVSVLIEWMEFWKVTSWATCMLALYEKVKGGGVREPVALFRKIVADVADGSRPKEYGKKITAVTAEHWDTWLAEKKLEEEEADW